MFVHLNINDTLYGYKSLYIYIWLYIMRFGGVKPQKSCFFLTFESTKKGQLMSWMLRPACGETQQILGSIEVPNVCGWRDGKFPLVWWSRKGMCDEYQYIIYKYDANDQVAMQPGSFMMFALVSWYDFTHVENYSDVEGLWEAFTIRFAFAGIDGFIFTVFVSGSAQEIANKFGF